MKVRNSTAFICLAVVAGSLTHAQKLTGTAIQIEAATTGAPREVLSVKINGEWQPVLSAASLVHIVTSAGAETCPISKAELTDGTLVFSGTCSAGSFVQHVTLTAEHDVVDVSTRLQLNKGASVRSMEDRYDFLPPRHTSIDEHTGPLDFVWSQDIKSEADDLIPTNSFKSPVLIMQQGDLFAALLPRVNVHHAETRAMDLDVTSNDKPWMSYGAIPSQPHGHSYFRRASNETVHSIDNGLDNTVNYDYSLVISEQPPRLGYRRVVRLLWERLGHPALMVSSDEQQNAVHHELSSFASWRDRAWKTDADRLYAGFTCDGKQCGTLSSDRNLKGEWDKPQTDAWFNPWFQTLRTAYGWYIHGRDTNDTAMMAKAESVLNLALSSPRNGGAFSTIYMVADKKWIPSDGWASYDDSYHAFAMSWTAYWMLRWAEDLTPGRKAEVLAFVKPYAEFLLTHQEPSGVIPSWYYASTLVPRKEFRDFNAETTASALLLATLGEITGDQRYIVGAEHGMSFIEREVLPRQRWFDYETYLSCARKDYSFFDAWTAQYPQNNMAEIQAPVTMLTLYRLTHKPEYLESGTKMLDYLLLTQQVWNNPLYTPMLLGGFTTQNTDQEWSDARQGYAAIVLADYYDVTGNFEYLERAITAARSTFAVAPSENWAHVGYPDEPGGISSFHWGTGSAMTSVELLSPKFGDAFIDLHSKRGVGFDQCTVTDVEVKGDSISFRIASSARERQFLVKFRGIDSIHQYRIVWNGNVIDKVAGSELLKNGQLVGPLK
ncbi:glycoside hydrolase family 88 protein [Terracidiphilus gabretensis]|uniref:hypothetical protein n=1 Tax=Terracidiphilus gabretensis TaxID=1577687 RepID=UPI00071C1077|nr:hypothetical protein [Terracidiphilus gabretensis]